MEPVELSRKQKFKNLEDVLDDNNYVELPPKQDRTFSYNDVKETVNIEMKVVNIA